MSIDRIRLAADLEFDTEHECPFPGCTERVRNFWWGCLAHWKHLSIVKRRNYLRAKKFKVEPELMAKILCDSVEDLGEEHLKAAVHFTNAELEMPSLTPQREMTFEYAGQAYTRYPDAIGCDACQAGHHGHCDDVACECDHSAHDPKRHCPNSHWLRVKIPSNIQDAKTYFQCSECGAVPGMGLSGHIKFKEWSKPVVGESFEGKTVVTDTMRNFLSTDEIEQGDMVCLSEATVRKTSRRGHPAEDWVPEEMHLYHTTPAELKAGTIFVKGQASVATKDLTEGFASGVTTDGELFLFWPQTGEYLVLEQALVPTVIRGCRAVLSHKG